MSGEYLSAVEDDDSRVKAFGLPNLPLEPIKVDEREDGVTIKKTQSVAFNQISPDMPHPADAPLEGRVSIGAPAKPTLEEVQNDLESDIEALQAVESMLINENPPEPAAFQFPNLAWESVKVGLAKERHSNDVLNGHILEAQKLQKDVDLLLDLSAELMQHKPADGDNIEMSDKLKTLLKQLKERGIDLWKSEETSLSKESVSELKSLSGAQMDKLRSSVQIIFTTKIQTLIQSIGAILECVKDIVRNSSRLISTINNKMSGR